jgi:hypothetical protein
MDICHTYPHIAYLKGLANATCAVLDVEVGQREQLRSNHEQKEAQENEHPVLPVKHGEYIPAHAPDTD